MEFRSILLGFSLYLVYFVDIVISRHTSSFVRSEWPSTDIPLDSEVFAVPKGYNAPEQVFVVSTY